MLKNKNGYVMIEVLIAIVVFSVAIITLLALQNTAMSSNQSSATRSLATNYAYDLIDKMRANKAGVTASYYINKTSGTDNSCRIVNATTVHTTTTACSSSQMAADDLSDFFAEVAKLPNGKAVICLDSSMSQGTPTAPNCNGSGTAYVVKIFWKDSSSQLINTNSGYSQVIIGAQL